MTPSQQLTELINRLHAFSHEPFSAEIQGHVQDAFGSLEQAQLTLEAAGLWSRLRHIYRQMDR